jgi:NAD-dependent deacetylase
MDILELEKALAAARSLCVLTGAGVSAESGIPTFRGPEGLWRQFRPEDLATPEAFARDPGLVWEWYAWRRDLIHKAQPNPAHHALARIEQELVSRGGCFTLATQNVDGLHERAGSKNVIRLHGSLWELRCTRCDSTRWDESVPLHPFPPRCGQITCAAMLRPGVVWFGESLPREEWTLAAQAAASADVFLVVGTSALVRPAASLPLLAKQRGARLIEINAEPTPLSESADLALIGRAGEILGGLQVYAGRGL